MFSESFHEWSESQESMWWDRVHSSTYSTAEMTSHSLSRNHKASSEARQDYQAQREHQKLPAKHKDGWVSLARWLVWKGDVCTRSSPPQRWWWCTIKFNLLSLLEQLVWGIYETNIKAAPGGEPDCPALVRPAVGSRRASFRSWSVRLGDQGEPCSVRKEDVQTKAAFSV